LAHGQRACDSRRSWSLSLSVMSIASPCIDICKFDSKTGFCIGCLRTRDECKSWKKMKDKQRRRIVEDRSHRERKLGK
jgi:uncharacterized protein